MDSGLRRPICSGKQSCVPNSRLAGNERAGLGFERRFFDNILSQIKKGHTIRCAYPRVAVVLCSGQISGMWIVMGTLQTSHQRRLRSSIARKEKRRRSMKWIDLVNKELLCIARLTAGSQCDTATAKQLVFASEHIFAALCYIEPSSNSWSWSWHFPTHAQNIKLEVEIQLMLVINGSIDESRQNFWPTRKYILQSHVHVP